MSKDPLIDFLLHRTRRRFTRLVGQTHQQVLDAAYRVTGNRHLAEDVTQEVFLKLLTVKWVPAKIRSGIGLLVSTAVLTALMRVRAEDRRSAREEASASQEGPSAPSASVDDILDLREAILGLPEALQACIRLRYYGGLSSQEIGAALGCAASTVRERLAQAREMLKKRLRPGAWAVVLPAFLSEAEAGLASIEPSPAHVEVLSRLGRDGPFMAACVASVGVSGGALKVIVAAAASLVAAVLGTWVVRLSQVPGAIPVGLESVRKATPAVSDQQAVAATTATTTVAQGVLRRITVRLEGDGEGWPPATIPIRVSGAAFEKILSCKDGVSVEILAPPGSYTIQADGRPWWSRETAEVTTSEVNESHQTVTLKLQDYYDLEVCVLSPEGRRVVCRAHLFDPFGLDALWRLTSGSASTNEFGELHLRLTFKHQHKLVVEDQLGELAPGRAQLANPEGLRRIRQEIVLERLPPIRGVILGCDGVLPMPTAGVTSIDFGDINAELHSILPRARMENKDLGAFVVYSYPQDHPFTLSVKSPGYAPVQVTLDPANLPEPLVIRLDCLESFHGRIEPPQPLNPRWDLWTEGSDLQSHHWVAEEDGAFKFHGKDLGDATLLIKGRGFEDLDIDLQQPSSRDNPAVLRPVAITAARVQVSVEGEAGTSAAVSVSLWPVRQQDWSNIMEAREASIIERTAAFEDVFPGRYDVIVNGSDGSEVARLEDQTIRGSSAVIAVRLPLRRVSIELEGTQALGGGALILRLDDAGEDHPLPLVDGEVDISALPGWHLAELHVEQEEIIYRGQLCFREDKAPTVDLSRCVKLEVSRNSADAPLVLGMYVSNRDDAKKQAQVAFALGDGLGKTTIRWLDEPGTHVSFVGQYGYYNIPGFPVSRKLEIQLGRLNMLHVSIEEGASSGRTFLIGKIPGQDMIYWYGCNQAASSGRTMEIPLECELSDWALLQYEGRILKRAIVNDSPLLRRSCRVRVLSSEGGPIAGAAVKIRGKELIGLDLTRYFTLNNSRSFFFTLETGKSDDAGMVELSVPAFPAMDLEVIANGQTMRMDVSPDQAEFHVRMPGESH